MIVADPVSSDADLSTAPAPLSGTVKTAPLVRMSGVSFTWPTRVPVRLTVDDFAVTRGEHLLLTGPSGGGKSTLLSLIAGIVPPQAGSIEVLGTDVAKLRGSARDRFRAEHYGIIFQMFNLLPYGSAIDNVLLPLSFSANRSNRAREAGGKEAEAMRLLAALGIDPSLISGNAAATLSVGQQQRVAAARALIGSPELIVADEPTSSLDRDRQHAFLDLLFAEAARAGATVIMVSHDETLASRFARVAVLADIAVLTRGDRS